ncbi:MAG: hypothetical protein JST00_03165 [Deltaproteobacteria bacterium]|nr:hypothetical protein [Deltaproteobacteria bacterium]
MSHDLTTLADEVNRSLEELRIGGGDYVVELFAPEGEAPPTLHLLRLRPRRDGYAVIVAGSVNALEKWGELRTYEHATLTHEMRSDAPMGITPAEWEQLLRKAEAVLHLAGIETGRVGPSPNLLTEHRRKRGHRKISPGALALFLVILVSATGVTIRVAQLLLAKE